MALFDSIDQPNTGHALETIVLHECLRRGATVAYVRTASGYEVDFLATHHDRHQTLIQVCADIHDAATLLREVRALQEARLEYPKARSLLVTLEPAVRAPAIKGIAVVQAMDWLLDGDGQTAGSSG